MNILKLVSSTAGSTKTDHNFDRQPAPESATGFFEIIKHIAKNKIEEYKSRVREETDTHQVLQMSDSMLKDIGLTQSDRASLKSRLTSLEELNTRRKTYYAQLYGENR